MFLDNKFPLSDAVLSFPCPEQVIVIGGECVLVHGISPATFAREEIWQKP